MAPFLLQATSQYRVLTKNIPKRPYPLQDACYSLLYCGLDKRIVSCIACLERSDMAKHRNISSLSCQLIITILATIRLKTINLTELLSYHYR